MAIKVVIEGNNPLSFPKLMKAKDNSGAIVWFFNPKDGVLLSYSDGRPAFEHRQIPSTQIYEDFHGKLILENVE
jgi:hypothetical protein